MDRNSVTEVWLQAQVDENGITLFLISEGPSSGTVVEEVEYFTLEKLAEMDGEIFNLTLSDQSKEALSENEESENEESGGPAGTKMSPVRATRYNW